MCCTQPGGLFIFVQKLNVPSGFSVTSPDKRGWFISPFGDKKPFPPWMMAASIVPALLVFILIFMETQITSYVPPTHTVRVLNLWTAGCERSPLLGDPVGGS